MSGWWKYGLSMWISTGLILILLPIQGACHSWYRIQPADLQSGRQDRNHNVELTYPDGTVVIRQPYTLDYPRLRGPVIRVQGTPMGWSPRGDSKVGDYPGAEEATFDLERAQLVRLWKISPWKVTAYSVGVPIGIVAIIMATKQSCPFVFVDDGAGERLVGEGYPSAIYRSIQREDLLRLPVTPGADLTLRLANLVDETQFTDRLDLLVLDHPPGDRALATAEAGVVVVGPAESPAWAQDLSGDDCLARVSATDQVSWGTDLQRAAADPRPPLRAGLSARFRRVTGRPVLEVQLRSTRWLEMVTGRYIAAMGDRFPDLLERLNAAEGAQIQDWRHREGIDLRAEVLRKGAWQPLGYIHPTGAACYRRVALPFPEDWNESGPIQVRLTGGTGFWQVDAIALSRFAPRQPQPLPVPSASARDQQGMDQRTALAAVDGRFQVMSQPGEAVVARFTLPPLAEGLTRTVFLRLHGYYNPHAPDLPRKSLRTLQRMLHREGAFVRFGLDIYRKHLMRPPGLDPAPAPGAAAS